MNFWLIMTGTAGLTENRADLWISAALKESTETKVKSKSVFPFIRLTKDHG